ncbi:uracil-DNA glycosylase [Glaciecola sp. MH2013]|uniref:uracil-DNA glycosylase n=1 Tax=Glaciecola sp. MH2013 TaxID=2785524 RepID=UPI00189D5CB9|nr:uracil-DNA glycosylase [Glaciecola sp. MH2013]MBF7071988.1 uracil-DNA glycosylase [Glaciecola sp. MH2013]
MEAWSSLLGELTQKAYFLEAMAFVEAERRAGKVIYPPQEDIFAAFELSTPENTKVVVLGQDPYHGPNQAHGLSFSVRKGNKIPPSLRNIYKELASDIPSFSVPEHGDLTNWAEQGVLLLNSVLTVEQGQAHSHKNIGWHKFTDDIIYALSEQFSDLVFILWGGPAQKKEKLINADKHFILKGVHPSPLSAHRGFFGCKHFSRTNEYLRSVNKQRIDWQL